MSSSHRILQTEQVHQPFPQWPRSDTVCSAPQRRHFGFGVISTFLTSVSGIKYSSLYGNGLATKRHKIHNFHDGILTKSIDVEYSPEIAGLRYAALELLINLATM